MVENPGITPAILVMGVTTRTVPVSRVIDSVIAISCRGSSSQPRVGTARSEDPAAQTQVPSDPEVPQHPVSLRSSDWRRSGQCSGWRSGGSRPVQAAPAIRRSLPPRSTPALSPQSPPLYPEACRSETGSAGRAPAAGGCLVSPALSAHH